MPHADGAADAVATSDSSWSPMPEAEPLVDSGITCGVDDAGFIDIQDAGASEGGCVVEYMERCTDGNRRYVSCGCDQAGQGSCNCAVIPTEGTGSGMMETFDGCPSCPSVAKAEAICTFPKQQP